MHVPDFAVVPSAGTALVDAVPLDARSPPDCVSDAARDLGYRSAETDLADIPIDGLKCRQVDRMVQEVDRLAKILIDDETHYYRDDHAAPETGADQRDDWAGGYSGRCGVANPIRPPGE